MKPVVTTPLAPIDADIVHRSFSACDPDSSQVSYPGQLCFGEAPCPVQREVSAYDISRHRLKDITVNSFLSLESDALLSTSMAPALTFTNSFP